MSETTTTEATSGEPHEFQAEVSRILHLMVHSVYSEKEVFLRELISNASDACDKLRYLSLTTPDLIADGPDFRIQVSVDKEMRIIRVADNGVGMSRDELIDNLGTIAKSGTGQFLDQLSGDAAQDSQLIGQFGVGFYAAFMVADRVDVISRKAGDQAVHSWSSKGEGTFEVSDVTAADDLLDGRGTTVTLHMRDGEDEFLDASRLKGIIKNYSDHVAIPIYVDDVAAEKSEDEAEQDNAPVNSANALWTRAKSDITEEQYKEFYHHVGHVFDDPSMTIHYKAEGRHEYSVLLFVPTERPMDLFDPQRQTRVKLYVKKVFITDDAVLLPGYLRFVRGIVDSEDMPLNISREMLQNNPIVTSIRNALTKRVLNELKKQSEKDAEAFKNTWNTFGPVLKEGLYEDFERQETLLEIARFHSTKGDELRSLKDYVADMKENQTAIYYIQGDDPAAVARSPQLEGYKARGLEVLLLSDPVDAFWTANVPGYEGKPFKSVAQGAADLDLLPKDEKDDADKDESPSDDAAMDAFIALLKTSLEGSVADVQRSDRLTDSPVCLVAGEGALNPYMERMLAASKGGEAGDLLVTRTLEVNPDHALIKTLAGQAKDGVSDALDDAAHLLLDQARIIEGESVVDTADFALRMVKVLSRSV